MDNQVYRCRLCEPNYFLQGDRKNEGHFATRFGDNREIEVLYEDGTRCDRCYEVVSGPLGVAWLGRPFVHGVADMPYFCDKHPKEPLQTRVLGCWRVVSTRIPAPP